MFCRWDCALLRPSTLRLPLHNNAWQIQSKLSEDVYVLIFVPVLQKERTAHPPNLPLPTISKDNTMHGRSCQHSARKPELMRRIRPSRLRHSFSSKSCRGIQLCFPALKTFWYVVCILSRSFCGSQVCFLPAVRLISRASLESISMLTPSCI